MSEGHAPAGCYCTWSADERAARFVIDVIDKFELIPMLRRLAKRLLRGT